MWRQRIVFLSVLTGLITILCHAKAFAPDNRGAFSLIIPVFKPDAEDDFATTLEDEPVTVNILVNDRNDKKGDDEDEEEGIIDPATVDLDPNTSALEKTLSTDKGVFNVDESGELTYIPTRNFHGKANIKYTVNDRGGERSNDATLSLTVTEVNDPPVITGQNPNPAIINEGEAFTIAFDNLIVTDPDDTYPNGFSIDVEDGVNYTHSGTTITPAVGFVGTLSVGVTVSDGEASSNTFSFQITVSNVNDVPVIVSQAPDPITILEDQGLTIDLGNLQVNDSDNTYPDDFSLIVLPGTNYTVNGSAITPAQNFNGALSVQVRVNDGQSTSNTFNLNVSVLNVNDAPVITGQNPNPLTIGEDESITIDFNHLLVSDPDDNYPEDFTIAVSPGTNYTLNGTTVTPASNFEGTLTVPVVVKDGEANSNTFSLTINVSGANDVPEITGQLALSTDEDESIRILLTDLTVTDSDSNYPADFTLNVLDGPNYSVSNTTVTPDADFSGELNVGVQVHDGSSNSNTFSLRITVRPVNDAPIITGQQNIETNENQAVEVTFAHLIVTDVDNVYPNGFSLSVSSGTNYTVSGNSIVPASGFNGTLSVPVTVSDGTTSSNTFNLQISVAPVNDAPVITGQNTLTVVEDNSLTILMSDITVTDSDNEYPNGFTLSVQPGNNYTASGNTIIPAADFNGTLSVSIVVSDGTTSSNVFPLSVTVTPVNDAPVITAQGVLATAEDTPITIQLADLQVTDPDNAYPTGFSLLLSAGDNYSLAGNTITPAIDFKGTLFVPAQVSDGELSSNVFTLQVSVADVNDAPIIVGQVPVSTPEDTPVSISLSHLDVLDTDNTFPQGFTLTILPGTNYTVNGNTITPAQDFTGTLNVSITVNDGLNDSAPFIFQIQVGDSNDPPVITAQAALSTNEEQAFTILLGHLTVVDPDNAYPNGFTLLVAPGVNYSVVDNVITPALHFAGTLIVPVRVNDGVNNSPTYDLKLEVLPVNDAPSFDAISTVNVQENAPPGTVQINNISKGPGEDSQLVTFSVSSSDPATVPNPVVHYNGTSPTATLAYTVMPHRSGVVTINVVATDNGGNTPPHQNTFSSTFQIVISEINNAPTLDVIPSQSMNEDSPLTSIPLTGISAGTGETQPLTLTVSTNKPELFEILTISYTPGAASGVLQVKPIANANGVANILITATDNGSNIAPSVNFINRAFVLSILPINDPPVFVSNPVTVAAVEEAYEYIVEIDDEESESLPITAEQKPAWLTLSTISGTKARLFGTPSASSTGMAEVRLVVKDGIYTVSQNFNLMVNSRPTVKDISLNVQEDSEIAFQSSVFSGSYEDINQHPMHAIQITEMPVGGTLYLSTVEVQPLDTIPASSIGSLTYKPDKDFFGNDNFQWKASDGYHFSKASANVSIVIAPVNDPPVIVMETDTLQYDINGEAALITTLFDVQDPDNDSLSSAEIAFAGVNYQPEYDQLLFDNSSNIRVAYDVLNGKLSFNGDAPIEDYRDLIRRIKYNHLNTIDPLLRLKSLTFGVNDGKMASELVTRFVSMNFTFIDLDIPTGFTPNGDDANDTWVISRPGGIEDFHKAEISVFNKRGMLVHRQLGFSSTWDGKFNGEVLPAGTYYFTIDLKLRSKKIYKGVVTILR